MTETRGSEGWSASALLGRVPVSNTADEREARQAARRHRMAPYVVWILLIASIVPWRRSVYFEGSFDPVVIAKAVVGIAALLFALLGARRSSLRNPIGITSIAFVAAFAGVALIGGDASGNFTAAGVSTVRIGIVAAAIVFVVRSTPPLEVIRSLLTSMALFGLFAAVSGVASIAGGDRLVATLPPLNPNDIALLCAAPAIGLLHELIIGTRRWSRGVPMLALLIAIVVLTQSRTGLLAMLAAFVVVFLHARSLRPNAVIALVLLVPFTAAAVTLTNLITSVAERGDASGQNIVTLSSRTIAWQAVLSTPETSWAHWIGSGMAVRQVQVAGQYWDNQVLDSSWFSALAQAGVVGVVIMAGWIVVVASWSFRARTLRSITTPLITFLVIRSFLENGLIDTNMMFVLFFSVALILESDHLMRSREQRPDSPQGAGIRALLSVRPGA